MLLHKPLRLLPLLVSASLISACTGDSDGDGITDLSDNCPTIANSDQRQSHPGASGDACLALAAMESGNPAHLPENVEPILDNILALIDNAKVDTQQFLQAIYGDDAIHYNPSRHSQFLFFNQREGSYPLIRGNGGKNLAAAVEYQGQRNAAFGTNIIRSFYDGDYLEYKDHFIKLLGWLLQRDDLALSETAQVRLMLMDSTTVTRTTSWLSNQFPNWQVSYCDEANSLTSCTSDADLIITGSQEDASADAVEAALTNAQANGAALLYVHLHSWNSKSLTNTVLAPMRLSMQTPGNAGNYFSEDTANWDSLEQMLDAAWDLQSIHEMISRFRSGTFNFDLSACASDCETAFDNDFQAIVTSLRDTIRTYDDNKIDIFATDTYQIEKLLVLLGDFYRRDISYPMDVSSSEPMAFLQAYFADHLVYNYRQFNPVQADLGTFSRTDFSHITPTDKTVELISKNNFRSAGVYALPGQTFTVQRLDNSDVEVAVMINSVRSGSTHQFSKNKYNRPKYLKSQAIDIVPGEAIKLTSPYGGPIQLTFDDNGQAVELQFENIGLHPHWSGPADNSIFAERLTSAEYDWAEVVTANFEVHSKLEKMQNSLSGDWSSAAELAAATEQYIHNYPHVLAGLQGPGIDVVPEIHNFASAKGWEIREIDLVKHMNADQATCGAGCSGNPYDAGWNFNPIGHGDIHEFGHGLEQGKFRFAGWDSHSTTNPYSYYSKTQYHRLTGTESSCQNLPFAELFATLQESLLQTDPFAYMQAATLTSWSEGAALHIQMMMAAQAQSELQDGWHLLPRLHILLREFQAADDNDEAWLAQRDSLGFSQFDRAEAKALSNNDWMAIALSVVSERNYLDFLTMWGLSYSDSAAAQVESFGYPLITQTYYQAHDADYCDGFDKTAIDIVDSDGDGIIDVYDAFPNDASESADADGDGIGDNQDPTYDLNLETLQYHQVELQSQKNDLCIGIDAAASLNGQQLLAVSCSADNHSLWSWANNGQIHANADASLCITSAKLGNDAKLSLSPCQLSDKQAWAYQTDDLSIRAVNANGLAFDLYSSSNTVNLYNFHGNSNQQWRVVE